MSCACQNKRWNNMFIVRRTTHRYVTITIIFYVNEVKFSFHMLSLFPCSTTFECAHSIRNLHEKLLNEQQTKLAFSLIKNYITPRRKFIANEWKIFFCVRRSEVKHLIKINTTIGHFPFYTCVYRPVAYLEWSRFTVVTGEPNPKTYSLCLLNMHTHTPKIPYKKQHWINGFTKQRTKFMPLWS